MKNYIVESIQKNGLKRDIEVKTTDKNLREDVFNNLKEKFKDIILNENKYKGFIAFETKNRIFFKYYI